jgi:ribosome maturation factor RimP
MNLSEKLGQIITEKLIENPDVFLVEVNVQLKGGMGKVTVILDGDNGVKIADCSKISRQLGAIIEEDNLIDTAYILEVTSPGIGEPLKLPRQFQANIGRLLKVEQKDGNVVEGTLKVATDQQIVIEPKVEEKKNKKAAKGLGIPLKALKTQEESGEVTVLYTNIKTAAVQLVF